MVGVEFFECLDCLVEGFVFEGGVEVEVVLVVFVVEMGVVGDIVVCEVDVEVVELEIVVVENGVGGEIGEREIEKGEWVVGFDLNVGLFVWVVGESRVGEVVGGGDVWGVCEYKGFDDVGVGCVENVGGFVEVEVGGDVEGVVV